MGRTNYAYDLSSALFYVVVFEYEYESPEAFVITDYPPLFREPRLPNVRVNSDPIIELRQLLSNKARFASMRVKEMHFLEFDNWWKVFRRSGIVLPFD